MGPSVGHRGVGGSLILVDQHRRWAWIGIGIVSVAMVYALAGGPLIYGYSRLGDPMSAWIRPIYLVVMRPHFAVAYRSEGYFAYLTWFQAGAHPMASHQRFCESYDRIYR